MRIVLFMASSGEGGAENLLCHLANQLAQDSRVSAIAVAAFDDALWLKQLSPNIERLMLGPARSRHNPLLYLQIIRQLHRFSPDIVNSHGAKAAQLLERVQGLIPGQHIGTKHNVRKGKVFNRMARVISVSQPVADSIQNPGELIYNGIPRQQVSVPSNQAEATIQLLAVGRLDPIKQFDQLITTLPHCDENICLQIAGEGPQREELEELIRQHQLSNRVQLLGQRQDIAQLMANSQGVIVCSRSEGFSLVLAESLFYAQMLLSTRVGIATEILPDSHLVTMDSLAARLNQMAANYPAEKRAFEKIRQQQAERFSVSTMADQYLNFFQQQLNEN